MAIPFTIRRKLRSLIPTSLMGRLALYLLVLRAIVAIIQASLRLAGKPERALSLSGWAFGLSVALGIVLTVLALRWIRRVFMWRLRNRLMVTYVFIGVVPLVLVVGMWVIAFQLFANQYATTQARLELDTELRILENVAQGIVEKIASGRTPAAMEEVARMQRAYPGFTAAAYRDKKPVQISESVSNAPFPEWTKGKFSGLVIDEDKLFLRTVVSTIKQGRETAVVSSIPLTKELLDRTAGKVGSVRFLKAERRELAIAKERNQRNVSVQLNEEDANSNFELSGEVLAAGGTIAPSAGSWDVQRSYVSLSPYSEWPDGKTNPGFIVVDTRPSTLVYDRLLASRGDFASFAIALLAVTAVFFGLIELIALFVGVTLTRTITTSVYQLYKATQHINRGELKHRIDVKNNDQMAALQKSFNSMTDSLERLIEEQKEKERLESELAIAQEVQATLFPREIAQLESLELYGVCRPARTVSGDYYDFIPVTRAGAEQLVLAVGDISGKGISAALLMATLHSAVRAFEFGRIPAPTSLVHAGAAMAGAAHVTGAPRGEWVPQVNIQSPAEVLQLLNQHLYHSTQPEKYATLFLSVFNGTTRTLTFSNAGHLPPFIIGEDGSVRKLEAGGIVIGLFDNMAYEESTVELRHGDIFVAYSDGITEPENEFGEFGEARLIQLVREYRHLPLERISEHVIKEVQDWIGDTEQPDDLTLVLARAR
jgi:sigma-B regulation protein RsbU (phosphoserine phosphatase)